MHEISKIPGASQGSEDADLLAAARCLQGYLVPHGWAAQPCDVLRFLAKETEKRLLDGKVARFTNVSIQNAVQRAPTSDPSKWMSRVWEDLTKKALPAREVGLSAFARSRGLDVYPWVGKTDSPGGAGNQALYYLDVRRIIALENTAATDTSKVPEGRWAITYIPELTPQPALGIRWVFDKSCAATGWRKWLLLLMPLGWLAMAMGLSLIVWLALGYDKAPLTTQNFVFLLLAGGMGAYGLSVFRELDRFLDDRIAPAPPLVVALKEFGVCVELHKPLRGNTDAPRSLRLVRYASQCPVCQSQVLLSRGDVDFPGRLIGRCQESPREHVFSFDRTTLRGGWLRGQDLQDERNQLS